MSRKIIGKDEEFKFKLNLNQGSKVWKSKLKFMIINFKP